VLVSQDSGHLKHNLAQAPVAFLLPSAFPPAGNG